MFNNCVLGEIVDNIKYCIVQSSLKMCDNDKMNAVEHYIEQDKYTLYYYEESATDNKGKKHHVMPNYESVRKYIDLAIQQAGDIENINEIIFVVELPSTFHIKKPTHPSIQSLVQKDSVVTPNQTDPYVTNTPSTNDNHNAFTTPNAPSNHHPFVTSSFHTPPPNMFHTPTSVPNDYNI
jgi:hypothetical protein